MDSGLSPLPLMIPALCFSLLVISLSRNAYQNFDVVYLLFGSSSMVDDQTMTIAYLFYNTRCLYEKGYAHDVVVIFVITMVLTLLQIWIGKRLKKHK